MRLALPFALALLLATGCHRTPSAADGLDAIDNDLVDGRLADNGPASEALAAAIHVDPAKAGAHGVASAPIAGQEPHAAPATPAATEGGEGSPVEGGSGCLAGLVYSNGWATKLPADLPMHPAARLEEAAGHDGACQARVVSFAVAGDRGQLLGWYRTRARRRAIRRRVPTAMATGCWSARRGRRPIASSSARRAAARHRSTISGPAAADPEPVDGFAVPRRRPGVQVGVPMRARRSLSYGPGPGLRRGTTRDRRGGSARRGTSGLRPAPLRRSACLFSSS